MLVTRALMQTMNTALKSTVTCVVLLIVGVVGMQTLCAQDNPDGAPLRQLMADRGGRSLQIEGDATALHVEVQQTAITDVLSALNKFDVQYRSSIRLDETLNGTYTGSLRHIVGRLLNGYNYAAKQDGSRLEVTIYGKDGQVEVPAPPKR
jgi:hypothetical protein